MHNLHVGIPGVRRFEIQPRDGIYYYPRGDVLESEVVGSSCTANEAVEK